MKNLIIRGLTGLIFISVIIGSILWDELITTVVLFSFFTLGSIEFFTLFRENNIIEASWRVGLVATMVPFAMLAAYDHGFVPDAALLLVIPFVFVLFIPELWRMKKNPVINLGIYLFAIFYLSVPFFLMVDLNIHDYLFNGYYPDHPSIPLLLGMFIMVWTNDTFAYLTGRMIGRTKLFERISPGKTWEGTIGGVLFTFAAAWVIASLTNMDDLLFWIVGAALIAPLSVLGDLLESMLKRSLEIKDTGSILPGHGGILDRFDAAIFVTPFFYAWTFFYIYF